MIARFARGVLLALAFVLLATANSAGYRYAASDQAFYIPAVLRHLDPTLFPADAPLIDSQARLTVVDEAIAAVVRVTGISLPYLFVGLYVATLCLLLAGAVRVGGHFFSERWTLVALAVALTLRHAIAKTGANTLEGYFHPRELAFAVSVWALACWIERRHVWCVALLIAAAAIHSTTALWFIVLIGSAAVVRQRLSWRSICLIAGAIIGLGAVVTTVGPLANRLARMDPAWLAVIAEKDYLFPSGWPADAWITNLLTIAVILACWKMRRSSGQTFDGEHALVAGAVALVLVFFLWLPFDAARVALAVQLQVGRLFWLLDFLGTIYLVWALAEWRGLTPDVQTAPRNGVRPQLWHRRAESGSDPKRRRGRAVAVGLIALSAARGGYSMLGPFHDRALFAVHIANDDWRDAMTWAQSTPASSNWLADPMHAARYGSSVRAAGQRDVFLEEIKDTAIAMYDRGIAMRVADRERALAEHPWDTVDGVRALAQTYGLDYLVIDRPLPLVEAHRAGALHIYRLR